MEMSPCPVDLFFFKKRTKRNIEFFFVPPLTLDRKKNRLEDFPYVSLGFGCFILTQITAPKESVSFVFFKRKKLSFTFTCSNIVYLEIKMNSFPFTGGIIR